MLPKVLCLLAITAFVASAPYSDRQYIDQLEKEYEDDRYDDSQTEDYGKIEDMQQQFQEKDEQTSKLKDTEQIEQIRGDEQEDIEQVDQGTGDEFQDIEQVDEGTGDEDIEQVDGEFEDIGQVDEGPGDEDIEQVDEKTGDEFQDIEQVDQKTGDEFEDIKQVDQKDDDWNQHDDVDHNGGGDIVQQQEIMDDLESDSAIGKLFGDSTVGEEPEVEHGYDQDKKLPEVGREFKYDQQQPQEEEVKPSYSSNYGSQYHPAEPFEPEVYTEKPLPWYKRYWEKTKQKAKHIAYKVKDTFGGK